MSRLDLSSHWKQKLGLFPLVLQHQTRKLCLLPPSQPRGPEHLPTVGALAGEEETATEV